MKCQSVLLQILHWEIIGKMLPKNMPKLLISRVWGMIFEQAKINFEVNTEYNRRSEINSYYNAV